VQRTLTSEIEAKNFSHECLVVRCHRKAESEKFYPALAMLFGFMSPVMASASGRHIVVLLFRAVLLLNGVNHIAMALSMDRYEVKHP
jgi:hypothetical protein